VVVIAIKTERFFVDLKKETEKLQKKTMNYYDTVL